MSKVPTIQLSEIMPARSGSVDPAKYPDELFELYSIPAFDNRRPEIVLGKSIGSTKQIVEPEDVLLSKIVPHIRRSWIVGRRDGKRLIASGEWIVFRGKQVDPNYLRHVLVGDPFHLQFMSTVSGVGGSLLRARPAFVAKIPIPLPPLAEQRRIAAILDKADELRAKRRAALVQLNYLAKSVFQNLFGDPSENPKRWPIRSVSDYVAEFQGGKSIDSEAGENVITRNRVLKISAVTGMHFLSDESKPVPDTYNPPLEHFVRSGDLLFSRANTTELVGAVAYVRHAPKNVLLPDKLWRFVWKQPDCIDPLFIWFLFQTPALRIEIGRRATGTSGSMKNISQEKLMKIPTILPPISLQRDFAHKLTAIEKMKGLQSAALKEMDALCASLQHRAFRGEL
jgi:type I restriction enzyme S subunit